MNEVLQVIKVDKVGRKRRAKREELEKVIEEFKQKRLYFVMGTHSYHPHRWLLIAVHVFPSS